MNDKRQRSRPSYDETRKRNFLKDNEKEDRLINHLEKQLHLTKRKKRNEGKEEKHPLWMRQCGLDYFLDFKNDISAEHGDAIDPSEVSALSVKKEKKRPHKDIYGQEPSEENVKHGKSKGSSMVSSKVEVESDHQFPLVDKADMESSKADTQPANEQSLHRSVRAWLNRISEAHMPRVISELVDLFEHHSKAVARSVLIEEVCTLIQSVPVTARANVACLHQELAACIVCVQMNMSINLQHDNLIGYLTEELVDLILPQIKTLETGGILSSTGLTLAYLFRFGALSEKLVFDLIREFVSAGTLTAAKAAHFVCIAVGVNLRKANRETCQEIIELSTNRQKIDLICELEGIIQRLSEKHSKEECVSRAVHLKKLMRSWIKGASNTSNICLSVGLDDIRNRETRGRWWLVGSSVPTTRSNDDPLRPSTIPTTTSSRTSSNMESVQLPPEVEAAANMLGLRTPGRRQLFQLLTATAGGPDATATTILRSCSDTSTTTRNAREREAIQLVLYCAMAEEPFNRFYPRVLGGFLNTHRRFLMMIKCAFWDALKRSNLAIQAKANAGRAMGVLVSVYDLPLTILKNYDFGDASDANVAFLRFAIAELCTGEYQKVLNKLLQLTTYTRLCRNCRIFMSKHFSSETDQHLKAFVLRLADDLRQHENV